MHIYPLRSPVVRTVFPTVFAVLAACTSGGRGDDSAGSDGGNDCSTSARPIYTIDDASHLALFDTAARTFRDLGALSCPVAHAPNFVDGIIVGEFPYSMAVARDAIYVLYHDNAPQSASFNASEMFRVDPATLTCTKTPWVTQDHEEVFGMAFSPDADGGDIETLFIAGAPDTGGAARPPSVSLASVDTVSMSATPIGEVRGTDPALAGTSDGRLWGFFSRTGVIQQIAKTTGAALGPAFGNASISASSARAWTFAFSGGDVYVFLANDGDEHSVVHQIGLDGSEKGGTQTSSSTFIVGAGVSPCR